MTPAPPLAAPAAAIKHYRCDLRHKRQIQTVYACFCWSTDSLYVTITYYKKTPATPEQNDRFELSTCAVRHSTRLNMLAASTDKSQLGP